MKQTTTSIPVSQPGQPVQAKTTQSEVPGRWSAVQRVRLPHKVGLPLSSGGGGDGGGE